MNCPGCHSGGTAVVKTVDIGDVVQRTRICSCGKTWKTRELEVPGTLMAITGQEWSSMGISRTRDLSLFPDQSSSLADPDQSKGQAKNHYSDEFESCWKLYGRKEEKIKAFVAWKKMAKTVGGETALRELVTKALAWQAPGWARDGWKFAKYFERYLKARKWEDEPLPSSVGGDRRGARSAGNVRNMADFLAKDSSK